MGGCARHSRSRNWLGLLIPAPFLFTRGAGLQNRFCRNPHAVARYHFPWKLHQFAQSALKALSCQRQRSNFETSVLTIRRTPRSKDQ